MIDFLKKNVKFLTIVVIFGLIGGYFNALYSIEIISPEILEETIAQIGSIEMLIAITTVQSISYAVILGLIGKAIAERIGLSVELKFEKKPLISVALISLLGGAFFILGDLFIFGSFNEVIRDSYLEKPTLSYIIASVTYGAVVEEVMLRLFFMSLIAFVLAKLSKNEASSERGLIIANIISALLFAVGHLPATAH